MAAGELNVIGQGRLNSALAQNFDRLNRSGSCRTMQVLGGSD